MANKGFKVKPRTTKNIRAISQGFKDVLKIKKSYFPIVKVVELLHQKGIIELEIVAVEEMANEYGLSYPKKGLIKIREDVYDKAVKGDGFGRFTIAHEMGHFMLHRKETAYARSSTRDHKTFEDSEWQANKFAQELLIDIREISSEISMYEIEQKFGVSGASSKIARDALVREGLIKMPLHKRGIYRK
ncbi:ImmA/IrrE family metallo-endopeptidase [uncultured Cocleimonas sp.]|uniref:ImmA/IrrE family metallo-endopeptidase n=1 Tax=uncultured Cocleimonas sp. TaxID=1051587 RepID=UPI0026309BF5|nr:ImmA/IrrE family metallo-endopeptidase [uncultured Cocleimonas sp.]